MLIICLLLFLTKPVYAEQNEDSFDNFLTTHFSNRSNMLITPKPEILKEYYNLKIPSSDEAYKQMVQRSMYLNA